jgi:hypothetical protein
MTLVHAARIDANGIYLGMDELPADQVTALHLPQITSCDLTPGKARWIPEENNPYGGHFENIKAELQSAIQPDALNAIALGILALFAQQPMPPETKAWLQSYFNSFDFKGF